MSLSKAQSAVTGTTAAIVGVIVLAAAGVVQQLATAERFTWAAGCGNDGAWYCRMAAGQLATEPFSRRILLPWIVRHFGLSGADGFAIVNAFVLAASLAVFAYLCVIDLRLGRARIVGLVAALAGLVFLTNRNTIHLFLAGPVLTDYVGILFLFIGGVALIKMSRDNRWWLLTAGVAFAGALARENLGFIIVAAAVFGAATRTIRWPTVPPILVAGLAGTLIAFSRPTLTTIHESLPHVIAGWISADFLDPLGLVRFGVMTLLGLGPLAFVCLARPREIWRDEACRLMAGMAVIFAAVSIFAGGDTDRILLPAGLLLAACALRLLASGVVRPGPMLLLVAAAWIWQLPLVVVAGDQTSILSFWELRVTSMSNVLMFGVAPILVSVPLLVAAFLLEGRLKAKVPAAEEAIG